ncbi:hypothetical protein ACP8NE_03345 [Corynebacterium ulcerans]|uniref:hypothetical protein n=1 Tax=Corynebacterium ulcerans TaxID=65058 RepID=UPI003D6FBBEC
MIAKKSSSAAALFFSALMFVACGNKAEVDSQGPSEADSQKTQETSNVGIPAATIGNEQRSWPDPIGRFDDRVHSTPGSYSVDMLGRQVWTPVAHDGDLPHRDSFGKGMTGCDAAQNIELAGKTQIQYVNARYLVTNDEAGPTVSTRGIPAVYAKTPQGAVLAAMNLFGYGLYGSEDEIGHEAYAALWQSSETMKSDWQKQGLENREPSKNARAIPVLAPGGYRVVSCGSDTAVVEVLSAAEGSAGLSQYVSRAPMVWNGHDWEADFRGSADALMVRNFDGKEPFHKVAYQ